MSIPFHLRDSPIPNASSRPNASHIRKHYRENSENNNSIYMEEVAKWERSQGRQVDSPRTDAQFWAADRKAEIKATGKDILWRGSMMMKERKEMEKRHRRKSVDGRQLSRPTWPSSWQQAHLHQQRQLAGFPSQQQLRHPQATFHANYAGVQPSMPFVRSTAQQPPAFYTKRQDLHPPPPITAPPIIPSTYGAPNHPGRSAQYGAPFTPMFPSSAPPTTQAFVLPASGPRSSQMHPVFRDGIGPPCHSYTYNGHPYVAQMQQAPAHLAYLNLHSSYPVPYAM